MYLCEILTEPAVELMPFIDGVVKQDLCSCFDSIRVLHFSPSSNLRVDFRLSVILPHGLKFLR